MGLELLNLAPPTTWVTDVRLRMASPRCQRDNPIGSGSSDVPYRWRIGELQPSRRRSSSRSTGPNPGNRCAPDRDLHECRDRARRDRDSLGLRERAPSAFRAPKWLQSGRRGLLVARPLPDSRHRRLPDFASRSKLVAGKTRSRRAQRFSAPRWRSSSWSPRLPSRQASSPSSLTRPSMGGTGTMRSSQVVTSQSTR